MRPKLHVIAWLAIAAAGAVSIPTAAAPARRPALGCSALSREVGREGASAVVSRLRSEGGWDRVLDRIGQGSAECVRLAGALKPGADAATSEGLRIALSDALQTNPAAVLQFGEAAWPLREICRDNHIEPTAAKARRFHVRAAAALSRVHAPGLAGRRDACLRSLERRGA